MTGAASAPVAPPSLVVLDVLEQAEALEDRPLPDDVRPGFVDGLIVALRWAQGLGPAPELPVPTDQCTSCDGTGVREGPHDLPLRCPDCHEGVTR